MIFADELLIYVSKAGKKAISVYCRYNTQKKFDQQYSENFTFDWLPVSLVFVELDPVDFIMTTISVLCKIILHDGRYETEIFPQAHRMSRKKTFIERCSFRNN